VQELEHVCSCDLRDEEILARMLEIGGEEQRAIQPYSEEETGRTWDRAGIASVLGEHESRLFETLGLRS